MKASAQAQRTLLRLQELDREVAQLRYQLNNSPADATITELTARAKDLHRAGVHAMTQLLDLKAAAGVVSGDLEKVLKRRRVQQERLDSGRGSAKELSAIQHEIENLVRRQGELEEAQMQADAQVEQGSEKVDAIKAQGQGLLAEIKELQATKETEAARLQARLDEVSAEIETVRAGVDAELLADYDYLRDRTGGLAVVAVKGRRVIDANLDLSVAEWDRIARAAADDVVLLEEQDVIIVRLGADEPESQNA